MAALEKAPQSASSAKPADGPVLVLVPVPAGARAAATKLPNGAGALLLLLLGAAAAAGWGMRGAAEPCAAADAGAAAWCAGVCPKGSKWVDADGGGAAAAAACAGAGTGCTPNASSMKEWADGRGAGGGGAGAAGPACTTGGANLQAGPRQQPGRRAQQWGWCVHAAKVHRRNVKALSLCAMKPVRHVLVQTCARGDESHSRSPGLEGSGALYGSGPCRGGRCWGRGHLRTGSTIARRAGYCMERYCSARRGGGLVVLGCLLG